MQKIYLVLSQSDSLISKLLKFFTKDEYNHISISLDKNLNEMYSFARLKPKNPLKGGFVTENFNKGMYKLFPNTKLKVYEKEIDDEKFQNLENIISIFLQNKEKYHYNIKGLMVAKFNKDLERDNYLYCSQFVRKCLVESKIINANELPKVVKPIDFLNIKDIRLTYKGLVKNYI